MIKEAIAKVVRGNNLTEAEMEKTMDEIMTGEATPAQIGAFVTALRLKGETVDEITGAARAMRAKANRIFLKNHLINIDRDEINVEEETILDTCGTGGTVLALSMSPPLVHSLLQEVGSAWPNMAIVLSPAYAEALM